jgi:hypothetical protein
MAKYDDQARRILKNIFAPKDKPQLKNPDNWIRKMTNLVGGTHYQHAHSDQAWPFDLEGERTFPFVATHGFGVHPFEMWLLPRSQRGKQEYGIFHTFSPTALLLMRGDFVHAGGAMWHPRCHMKFFPRTSAGLVWGRNDNYWLLPNFKQDISQETTASTVEQVFLWQHYNFPFAFPKTERTFNTKLNVVEELIMFPPELTQRLLGSQKGKGRRLSTNSEAFAI